MRFKDRRGEVVYVDNGRGYQRESPKPKHVTGTDKERGPRGGRHRKRREAWEAAVTPVLADNVFTEPFIEQAAGRADRGDVGNP